MPRSAFDSLRPTPRGAGPWSCALLVAFLAACGSTGAGGGQETRGGVSIGELSAAERGALEAWRAGEEAWLARRAAIVADPDLAAFLVDNLVVVMVRSYDAGHLPREGPPERPFERARAELVRLAEHSAPVLAELLVVGDGVVAYLAGEVLGRLGAELAAPAVAERLGATQPEARRRSAEVLGRLGSAGPGEGAVRQRLAALLVSDPEWFVRAQAARALGARCAREPGGPAIEAVRGALERGLWDEDPEVRASAATALVGLGDLGAVPELVRRLGRASRDGAELSELRALQSALRRLTGVGRDLDVAGWRAWMDQNAAALRR